MKSRIPFPLIISLLVLFIVTSALLLAGLQAADGHFGYSIDDVYIHMAIAKNFVLHGVWGITPHGFTSTTSSPLWTLLIALMYKIFGVNEWAPFALGVLAGSAALILCYCLIKRKYTPLRLTLLLLLFIFLTGMPFWMAMGMEHVLHGVLTIGLIYYAVRVLVTERVGWPHCLALFVLSALLTFTRYEGMFLAGVLFLLFLLKKRPGAAFAVLTGSLFLISVYGLISVRNGWFFFPNTILLKGNLPELNLRDMAQFLTKSIFNLFDTPQLFMLVLVMLMVYWRGATKNEIRLPDKYLFGIFFAAAVIHLQFSAPSTFSRYGAYLVLSGFVILTDKAALFFADLPAGGKIRLKLNDLQAAGVFLLALPMLQIAFFSGILFRDHPRAVQNIHDQQYQMGRFLQKYYSGKTAAVNDIGLVSFMSGSRVLDLWGLGSLDVAKEILQDTYYSTSLTQLSGRYDTRVVIIFDSWFRDVIPSEWVKVGEWQLPDNVVCGDDYVSFYAVSSAAQEELAAHLREFSGSLPARVIQRGLYTQ